MPEILLILYSLKGFPSPIQAYFSFFALIFYALRAMLKKQEFCSDQKWLKKMHTTRYAYNMDAYIAGSL